MSTTAPPRGTPVPPFYAGEISRRAGVLARQGREIVPMHFGEPTAGTPPAAAAAAIRALETGPLGYWESAALRERIARHYHETYGVEIEPQRILLTTGASAGLVAAFTTLFAPGDRIALVRPGYPAYRNALRALGREPVAIDCGAELQYRLTPERVAAVAGPLHGIVVMSPGNPTGAMLDRAALAAIAAVCRDRGTRLISDEIYHGIAYGREAVTALAVDPDAIVVNSFSKLYRMPGWRLGWLVAPAALVPSLSACLVNFFLTPPAIAQHAALAACDDTASLRATVAMYAHNRALLLAALPRLGLATVLPPDGAFYLYLDMSHLTRDSLAFCQRLLDETGVALAPGIDFDPEHGHGHVRLSFAVTTAQVERALDLLAPWLARQPRL